MNVSALAMMSAANVAAQFIVLGLCENDALSCQEDKRPVWCAGARLAGAAVAARGRAGEAAEHARQVFLVREAALQGDIGDARAFLAKQRLGALDPKIEHVWPRDVTADIADQIRRRFDELDDVAPSLLEFLDRAAGHRRTDERGRGTW